MKKLALLITMMYAIIIGGEAFFKPRHHKNLPTYVPKTLDEVKNYLCERFEKGICIDTKPAKIIINKVFDFTGSEGMKEELGCYHRTMPAQCLKNGQMKLNVNNQCDGLVPTRVRYSQAGRCGIDVGSNKIIVGENGGGLIGKGLKLRNSHDVEIRNLNITDINPQVIWGGDAIDLINVENVLLDGNRIKNIGRQMVVTHFGNNTGVLMTNNIFDGNTPNSACCDGSHYWLWLFLGEYDRIALRNNVIFNTSGRGPHLVACKDSKILLHMLQNTFYDVKNTGLIDLDDTRSSVLVEGNVFVNVKEIVHANKGNIYMPQNRADQLQCESYLGRRCLLNTVVNSGGAKPVNSLTVLQDFKPYKDDLAKPIVMKAHMTKLINLPSHVKQNIK